MNKKEYNILSFYLSRSLLLGGNFSYLITLCNQDTIISITLGFILGYFLLYLFYKRSYINPCLEIIIYFFILIILFLSLTILTSTYLLVNTPILLIQISFLSIILYENTKEFNTLPRISFLFIFFSILIIIIAILSLIKLLDIENLFPLFKTNIINILKGSLTYSIVSILPNITLLKYKGNLKFKDISLGYIFSTILTIIIVFFILSIYGIPYATYLRFPEYSILKNVELITNIHNLENIFIMEWIVTLLICSSYYFYNLTKNNHLLITLITIPSLLIIIYILTKYYPLTLLIKKYMSYFFGILLLLCLITNQKRRT